MILEIKSIENDHIFLNMDSMTTMYIGSKDKIIIEYGGSMYDGDRILTAAIAVAPVPYVNNGRISSTTMKILRTIIESLKKGEKYLMLGHDREIYSVKYFIRVVND